MGDRMLGIPTMEAPIPKIPVHRRNNIAAPRQNCAENFHLHNPSSTPAVANENTPSLEIGYTLGSSTAGILKAEQPADPTREPASSDLAAIRLPLASLSISNLNSHPKTRPRQSVKVPRKTRDLASDVMHRRPSTPYPRRPIQGLPVSLRVYFMPDGRHVHESSVIHKQKRQNGFFLHPILVISCDESRGIAHFYALTSNLPEAIRDLSMYLRFGTTIEDEGSEVLKLLKGSDRMHQITFANMEQLFCVEHRYLDYWRANVSIDPGEIVKIEKKVNALEAEQNRYIYKPLQRSMKDIVAGVILMLPNPPSSSTLGAPILILDVRFPYFRFQRVKEISVKVTAKGTEQKPIPNFCVRMDREPSKDGEPVLLFASDSPPMRNPSYLECSKKLRWVHCDQLKTWSYPHVRIQPTSMKWLMSHLARLKELAHAQGDPRSEAVIVRRPSAFPETSIPRLSRTQSLQNQRQRQHPPQAFSSHPVSLTIALPPAFAYGRNRPGYPSSAMYSGAAPYQQQDPVQDHFVASYSGYAHNRPPTLHAAPAHSPGWPYYQPELQASLPPLASQMAYMPNSISDSASLNTCYGEDFYPTTVPSPQDQ